MGTLRRKRGALVPSMAIALLVGAGGVLPAEASGTPTPQRLLQWVGAAERQANSFHMDEYITSTVGGKGTIHITEEMDMQFRPRAVRAVEVITAPHTGTQRVTALLGPRIGSLDTDGMTRCVSPRQFAALARRFLQSTQFYPATRATVSVAALNGRKVWVIHTTQTFQVTGSRIAIPFDVVVDSHTHRLLQGTGRVSFLEQGRRITLQAAAVFSRYGKAVSARSMCG